MVTTKKIGHTCSRNTDQSNFGYIGTIWPFRLTSTTRRPDCIGINGCYPIPVPEKSVRAIIHPRLWQLYKSEDLVTLFSGRVHCKKTLQESKNPLFIDCFSYFLSAPAQSCFPRKGYVAPLLVSLGPMALCLGCVGAGPQGVALRGEGSDCLGPAHLVRVAWLCCFCFVVWSWLFGLWWGADFDGRVPREDGLVGGFGVMLVRT